MTFSRDSLGKDTKGHYKFIAQTESICQVAYPGEYQI